jgi:GNAT superfamily N-acetyltransferase
MRAGISAQSFPAIYSPGSGRAGRPSPSAACRLGASDRTQTVRDRTVSYQVRRRSRYHRGAVLFIGQRGDVGRPAARYGFNRSGSGRVLHTVGMIRIGTSADLAAATGVYRRALLSNAGDRDNLLAHPEYLILGPAGLAEGRTHVAVEDGLLVGFATWIETAGTTELEDLFVDPGYMRRGIAAALVNRIVDVLRPAGVERLEVTANPHALGFYRAAGFIDCGVVETEFGPAARMELAIS